MRLRARKNRKRNTAAATSTAVPANTPSARPTVAPVLSPAASAGMALAEDERGEVEVGGARRVDRAAVDIARGIDGDAEGMGSARVLVGLVDDVVVDFAEVPLATELDPDWAGLDLSE